MSKILYYKTLIKYRKRLQSQHKANFGETLWHKLQLDVPQTSTIVALYTFKQIHTDRMDLRLACS